MNEESEAYLRSISERDQTNETFRNLGRVLASVYAGLLDQDPEHALCLYTVFVRQWIERLSQRTDS